MEIPNYGEDSDYIYDYNYTYEYDYDTTERNIPLKELILINLVFAFIIVIGFIGNILVMRFRKQQTTAGVFLVNLSAAHLGLILCLPIKMIKYNSFSWNLGELPCKMMPYLENVTVFCSVFMLTIISIERYVYITSRHPEKRVLRNHGFSFCAIVWLVAFLLALPIIFGQVHKEVGFVHKTYWCITEWPTAMHSIMYEVSRIGFVLMMPSVLISIIYLVLCIKLWGNQHPGTEWTSRYDKQTDASFSENACQSTMSFDIAKARKGVIMLMLASAVFIICWMALFTERTVTAIGLIDRLSYGSLKHVRLALSFIAYASCSLNPFIYLATPTNVRGRIIPSTTEEHDKVARVGPAATVF